MNINDLTLDELYKIKGRLTTDLDIIKNDLNVINAKIIEARQEKAAMVESKENKKNDKQNMVIKN